MARYRESYTNTYQSATSTSVQILRSFGTIDSKGVAPSGETCTGAGTEVEFSLNIYQTDSYYCGEVYLVDYDNRRKVNSNQLVYFEQSSMAQMICIFRVESVTNNCTYQLIVSVSPTNCSTLSNGMFYAYVPPIYNQGLNVGGVLKTGEVTIYNNCYDCDDN